MSYECQLLMKPYPSNVLTADGFTNHGMEIREDGCGEDAVVVIVCERQASTSSLALVCLSVCQSV